MDALDAALPVLAAMLRLSVPLLLAALLFGALTQGGAELAFEMPAVPSDVVVLIQGLVILFAGALGNMLRPGLLRVLGRA